MKKLTSYAPRIRCDVVCIRSSGRESPGLVIVSEGDIPPAYWSPQPPKLNRQALLADAMRGDDIPGVQLSNPKLILTVRTK